MTESGSDWKEHLRETREARDEWLEAVGADVERDKRISVVEAVRLGVEHDLADDFAAIIHDRHMRFITPSLAVDDCIDYDDHYGLAWAIVRHLSGGSD